MTTLISAQQVQDRVRSLADEIRRDHGTGDLHLVCVLKGAFVFMADLLRALPDTTSIDFMALSSYGKGTSSSGEVRLLKDLDFGLEGRDVVIVEDIVDTGFTIEDKFVVGYGLDYAEKYRSLPFIGVLEGGVSS